MNISMLSYNSTGWSPFKVDFLNTILITHGIMICAVQEHFQLVDNLYKVDKFKDFKYSPDYVNS